MRERFLRSLLFISLAEVILSAAMAGPGLQFIENRNQWHAGVDFGSAVPGGKLFINRNSFSYYLIDEQKVRELHEARHHPFGEPVVNDLSKKNIRAHLVQMQWQGSNNVTPQPFGRNTVYYNYFLGNDSTKWAGHVASYEGALYTNFYRGIDLKVYSQGNNLKYDFIVSPGADPSVITGAYIGADQVSKDAYGDIYIRTQVGEMIEKRPYTYQVIRGKKVQVKCAYRLVNDHVSFYFPEGYDHCETLVIDPLLIFSTYSGSTADNWGSTATPGEHGRLYSAGVTILGSRGSFPATPGAFQVNYGGIFDVAILKYDSLGSKLLYASYLGGKDVESAHSMVMNQQEELLILGTTGSNDFPVSTTAFDKTFGGGSAISNVIDYDNGSDIYIARISSDGSKLLSSTYLGGTANDGLNPSGGLAVNYGDELRGDILTDNNGNVFISSVTSSTNFPGRNSFDVTYNSGATDAVLVKLSPDLSQVLWSAFVGGSGLDASHTLKLDSNGDIFIAGGTNSNNFPVTAGAYQTLRAGSVDGWIAHVKGDGSSIINSTFTGTAAFDQVYFLDLDEEENVYVYGQTAGGMAFPISAGVYHNTNSGQFVQKLGHDLDTLLVSTVFGSGRGLPDISPTAFMVNECNNLYMSGWGGKINEGSHYWSTDTKNMPLTPDAYQDSTSGSDFYFIVLTDDASQFLYGTYLGGPYSRTHVDGGTSRFDKSGIVYHAVCSGCAAENELGRATSDFPTTPNAWSRTNRSQNCNNAAFKYDLSSLRARLQTNSVKLDMPGLNKICIPDKIVFQNRCTGGKTFEWDLGDGTTVITTDTAAITHQYQNAGQYTVKLKAIDPGTCKVTDSTSAVVYVFIRQSQVQDDDDLCAPVDHKLIATGGVIYYWISDDKTFESTEQNPRVTPTDTTGYYVEITEASGCIVKDTVQLNVIPAVHPEFDVTILGDCVGRPIVLVHNRTEDTGDAQMIFDFGDGHTSEETDVTHTYEEDNTYSITLRGINAFCVYEKEVPVPIYTLKFPNVITPGYTDNANDRFSIQAGDDVNTTPGDIGIPVSLVVYNRWGSKVFESNDYQYNWSGEGLAAGTYYYEATVANKTCKSWVQIIK